MMSQMFTKTRREAPADEVAKNAQLLIRAGFIYKEMAGVYAYTPIGLRVLTNIIQIIREEMNAIGGQEISMTGLQNKSVWEKTDRWSDEAVDVWFKTELKSGSEVGLGFTHEEPITNMLTQYIDSYRDLPFSVYQFQTKFRNETRAKSGIMRTREFIMKDLYSFCKSQAEHEEFYEKAHQAYVTIFNRLGIGDKTLYTFASGGSFAKYSHEFQTITDAGEDIVYYDPELNIAINEEIYNDETIALLGVDKSRMIQYKTSESGNIFSLGTRFSDAFSLTFKDEQGVAKPVIMGSYGIGPGRVMGTIVELLSDEKGIVWPESVAPFRVHIVCLGNVDSEEYTRAKELYDALIKHNIETLFDNRSELSAGQKLGDADLIGIPHRIVVSAKSITAGGFAYKARTGDSEEILSLEQLVQRFA